MKSSIAQDRRVSGQPRGTVPACSFSLVRLLVLALLGCVCTNSTQAGNASGDNAAKIAERGWAKINSLDEDLRKADPADITNRLYTAVQTLRPIPWQQIAGPAQTSEHALRRSWFINATMYPVDSGMAATNETDFVAYMSAMHLYASLLQKRPREALTFLLLRGGDEPTLLDAMLCGVTLSLPFDAKLADQRDALLASKNPIIRSCGLAWEDNTPRNAAALTKSVDEALQSEWLSLQHIALETAAKHASPGMTMVLERYVSSLSSSRVAPEVKEVLRAKAIEAQSRLVNPPAVHQ